MEKNFPEVLRTADSHKKEMAALRKAQVLRGKRIFESNTEKALAEELGIMAEGITEGDACNSDNVVFCSGTCKEAAEYLLYVAAVKQKEALAKRKQEIESLCKAKPPKEPGDLLNELDLAMDKVLSNEGSSFEIAEALGAAQDFIAQKHLHIKPAEEEDSPVPGLLREAADILEDGDEVHPENTKFILNTVWEVLDYLKWDKKLPAGKRISQEALSFVSEKLLEVDEILAKLSKEKMDESQTRLILALAENIWRIMAKLFPGSEGEE